jgi:hypothetical protein
MSKANEASKADNASKIAEIEAQASLPMDITFIYADNRLAS